METITVTKPFLPDIQEYEEMVSKIWENRWLTNNGQLLKQFQEKLENYIGNQNIVMTTNGHMALDIAIRSLGYTSGEVITTPFTFASTTHAITSNNLTPVFCDIDPKNLTLDAGKIEALITENTRAIVPVHVYGHPCDVEKIEAIASKYGLEVIYDAAHTFAERYNGRSLASYGYASIYSFHATKLFHSVEGGAIIFRDSEKEKELKALKNFGILDETTIEYIGGNAKMNEFQAAMGLVNLRHIDEIVRERRLITTHYRQQLSKIHGVSYFEPDLDGRIEYNYAYLPVLIEQEDYGVSRDELYEELKKEGILARRYFYPLLCDVGCYRYLPLSDVPVARKVASSVLCLPIYNGLALEDIDRICSVIAKVGGYR